jgi:uncharacterized delta-60 repeat protein
MVKILNVNADPYGPNFGNDIVTNSTVTFDTNTMTTVTNFTFVTNLVLLPYPTNAVFNFQKANYRVPADVNDPANPRGRALVTIYVERFGTNTEAATLNYTVNNYAGFGGTAAEEGNNVFPLQPGSDYAVPTPANTGGAAGTNLDFNMTAGTISFPNSGNGSLLQPISFTVPVSTSTKFNRDFRIQLYRVKSINGRNTDVINGMVAETTVTILFDDQRPPAGSVDELYNADFNTRLALPPAQVPQTWPGNNINNPGVSGEVYGMTVLTNDQTLIVGDYGSYNGVGQNNITLLNKDSSLNSSFNPGLGPRGAINAVANTGSGQFIIGGDFDAYNGQSSGHYARLNANGSLDTSFSTARGSGADASVRAVAVQQDGKVLIGGDFTHVNGVTRNYMARLNADGSLDSTFDPGNTFNGPVYSLALPPTVIFNINRTGNRANGEDDQPINLGTVTSGILTVNYRFAGTNEMTIYYGDTNVTALTGVQIYDTGITNGIGTIVVPFGPTGIINTNLLTIVMNQGGVSNTAPSQWNYSASVSVVQANKGILVGGLFNVAGQPFANIARLNTADGSLDTTFNPGTGTDNKVLALGWQLNDQIVAGGVFNRVNGSSYNHIVRFNPDGSLDTANFFIGTGADNVVYSVTPQFLDGTIYVGGAFASINGTHRLGFARLYANGTLDTTFLDTAYNQFAGLKRIYSYDSPAVFASAVQSDGNVMIGGTFNQVGGGQADTNVCNTLDNELFYDQSFNDPNLWVEPKSRDGVRNRGSIARLIGGATPGPGNLGFKLTSYSKEKSKSSISVDLVRTNGTLGPVLANFSVIPGLAQSGSDYVYYNSPPLYWIGWNYITSNTRKRSDGLAGVSGFLSDAFGRSLNLADAAINNLSVVNVSIIKNTAQSGDLNAAFQLANPSTMDTFYLGGQNIPVGGALGASVAPLTIIDDTQKPGTFGFSSPTYTATNLSAVISVVRSNGVFGNISMRYSTTNGTALAGADYTGITNQNLVFNQNVTSNGFAVTVKNTGLIYTNATEKTVNLRLFNLGNIPPGATFGISNAVLRIINPNFQGYLALAATNFNGAISSGYLSFVVNRIAGSLGTLTVQYRTANGTALNGIDYIGTTNTLTWNSSDVSPRTVTIPLINPNLVGPNKQLAVSLFNPTLNGSNSPALFGLITNATLTITNDNSIGVLQFSSSAYIVNENGGYATVTVNRTGGAAGTVSAFYSTSDGTALKTTNYTSVSGTLTLAPGQISTNINIPILNDNKVNPAPTNFFFNVSLNGPGTLTNAVVQIVDASTYNYPPGSPDTAFATPGMNASIFSLALQPDGKIVAGGNFTAVGTVGAGRLARLNADGTFDAAFLNGLTGANGAVISVAVQTDGRILAGGSFTTVNNVNRRFIARLQTDGTIDTSFNPGLGADNTVSAVAETFVGGLRKIYVGGAFGVVSGLTSPGLARLNDDGSADGSFAAGSGADGSVYAIAVYPTNSIYSGKVIVGGTFTHFNGNVINRLARFNSDGSPDTSFNASLGFGPNDAVHAIAVQADGKIVVGGSFTNFNGAFVNHVLRLNADGTRDTNFVASANDSVEGIALQSDSRIVLVGQFTSANNVTRNHITRLMPSGATDPTINFGAGANGDVDTVVIQPNDGMMVIGGGFTKYFDDQPRNNIARIYGGSVTGSGAFEFTAGNYTVDETGVFAPITIRRTGGTSGTNADLSGSVFVNFATSNGTAVAGINYRAVNTNLAFPAGEVLQQVLVPILDDLTITPDLDLNLILVPQPPAGVGTQTRSKLTILNQDNAVSFDSVFYSQLKNVADGFATVNIVRQGGANNACSVDFYTTTNGTAIAGVDFIPTNRTVVFSPGVSNVSVQVAIINNGLPEGNTTVGLLLTNAVNTLLYAPSNAVLTIVDTTPAPGQLSFNNTNYFANEADGTATLTVVRTSGSQGTVSVAYQTSPGTAQPGINYTAVTGTLTFGSGETTKSIVVPLVDNNLVQGVVNLTVFLKNPTGGATLLAPTNATLSISDNDTGFVFTSPTNTVREINGTVPIFVQRIGIINNNVTVNYATANGTAIAGRNYTAVSGTLNFGVGQTTRAISLPLLYDSRVTGDLTLNISLSSPASGTVLGSPSNTVVVVQDADAGLGFTNANISVFKNSGFAVITVVCSNPSVEPVIVDSNTVPLSVHYATADGTALAGTDYSTVSGTLIFTNGVGTNTFTVPIINNSQVNGNRAFTVQLSSPTAPGQLTSPSVQTVTIIDNNAGLRFSSPVYSVLKSSGAATITIQRIDNINTNTTVNFTTVDGTGVAGVNYVPTNGTAFFTNGETSKTFTVLAINDTTQVQPDKTVLLQLSSPTNGVLIPPYVSTLTIRDTSGSFVVPSGSAFAPGGDPNANGLIDPGETVSLMFAFRVAGGTNVPSLTATLLTTNGITAPSPAGAQSYGALTVGGQAISRPFTFTASGTNGQAVAATFKLQNGATDLGTAVFTYTLGTVTRTFANTNAIIVNDNAIASPYPSTINVSGVGGLLIKSVVTLTNISYGSSPQDMSVLLVAPGQQDTLIMAHTGGQNALSHVTLTFDDAASNSLPRSTLIISGTNKPTAYLPVPNFP